MSCTEHVSIFLGIMDLSIAYHTARLYREEKNGLYVVARNFSLALPGSCLAKHTNFFSSPLYSMEEPNSSYELMTEY